LPAAKRSHRPSAAESAAEGPARGQKPRFLPAAKRSHLPHLPLKAPQATFSQ